MEKDKKTLICPKCGDDNIYIGAFSIECGVNSACENYTERQAEIINEEKSSELEDENDYYGFSYLYDNDDYTNFL